MNRKVRRVPQRKVEAFILSISLCLCGSFSYATETITVAVASSFYAKAKIYSTQFEAKHDVKVRLISGSTGRLFNQITQGAPFDIFIAADKQIAAKLEGSSKVVGQGYLGLRDSKTNSLSLTQLSQPNIQHIAIANPQVAPFGKVAKQVLKQAGLWQTLKPKLVYAQNAMQASMMLNQGLVDAGFVPINEKDGVLAIVPYMSVLLSDTAIAGRFYETLDTLDRGNDE